MVLKKIEKIVFLAHSQGYHGLSNIIDEITYRNSSFMATT